MHLGLVQFVDGDGPVWPSFGRELFIMTQPDLAARRFSKAIARFGVEQLDDRTPDLSSPPQQTRAVPNQGGDSYRGQILGNGATCGVVQIRPQYLDARCSNLLTSYRNNIPIFGKLDFGCAIEGIGRDT